MILQSKYSDNVSKKVFLNSNCDRKPVKGHPLLFDDQCARSIVSPPCSTSKLAIIRSESFIVKLS